MKNNIENSMRQTSKDMRLWRSALYIRLSREDEGEKEESCSVTSQREILKAYINQHEEFILSDIYVDDGYSGTNFDRPDFKRMISDIEKGEINCVIVKDLSRFCRNAVDGGYYLDDFFQRMQVRFIAINNCLDTFSSNMNASTRCITVGVQNVINESVAATTSVNVRGTLDMTRAKGGFIGSFACYGYKKSPLDHHKLIVDKEAAEVVKLIFRKFLEGRSILSITKEINEMGIPSPSMYKKMKGLKYSHSSALPSDGLWSDRTIRRILQNETYIGNMVQGKKTTISYKIKKCRSIPQENWIVVENTHEAVISKEDFYKAQSYFSPHVHTGHHTYETDLFAGLIRCSECQRVMNKKTYNNPNKTYIYYKCATRNKMKALSCESHTIRRDSLERAVLSAVQRMVDISFEISEIEEIIKKREVKDTNAEDLTNSLNTLTSEREKLFKAQTELYPDWKEGLLTKEEYLHLKGNLSEKISAIDKKTEEIKNSIKDFAEGKEKKNEFLERFKKYGKLTFLTRSMVLELIEKIVIYPENKIEIFFKFRDAYKDALDYLSKNGFDTASLNLEKEKSKLQDKTA